MILVVTYNVVFFCPLIIPPPQNVGGGILDCFVASVGQSVSNSCPLYNSFTNGRISIKLEWHIHLN